MVAEFFKTLIPYGYKCFIVDNPRYDYGYVITPSDNVMYVEWTPHNAFNVSLEYVPSRENGTGCSTISSFNKLSVEVFKEYEQECISFAKSLGVKMYPNSTAWLHTYYNKNKLIEISK